MNIAILGFARDGQAAFEHWNTADNQLTICDQDPAVQVPAGAASQLGPDYLKDLARFDLLVRSAGLSPAAITAANPQAPDILSKVTGNIDEFYRCSPSRQIIGVTGTKGKGTTCTLLAKFLEAAGRRVHLGGNIGIPALELLKNDIQPDDWVVLEQSSFQLVDQQHSPHIAVCLMVVPEHLNWHTDLRDYHQAKQQLFARQTADDIAIYNAQNPVSQQLASSSKGQQIPYLEQPGAYVAGDKIMINEVIVCQTSDVKLLGAHNLENVCAAITAFWQISQDAAAIKQVLTSFAGLPHHLELVRNLNGVAYYDDSFGTTPETAIVALQAFSEPKVIILGGSDKGASYNELAKVVTSNNVRAAVLIGDTAPAIEKALHQAGFDKTVAGGQTIGQIIKTAQAQAQTGDVVILSPACASFGLFTDYKDRGQQFQAAVKSL